MCNKCSTSVPSVSLQTAVLLVVREFANSNKPFSIHDITRTVRTKAFNGELEIPESVIAGTNRYDIPHTKIKALFDDLWRTGVFDPEFTLNRQFINNTYFEYTPTSVNGAYATTPTPPVQVISVSAPVQPNAPSVTPSQVAVPFVKPSKKDVSERVELYLDNCATRNFRPTLKQVQSAIKRNNHSSGWTCEELQEIIEIDLGYDVVASPDYLSASQVAVV